MPGAALKWTIKEKQKLADLLIQYPLNAYKTLAKKVKTKSAEQVELYIKNLEQVVKVKSIKTKSARKATIQQKAPLDHWACMTRDLVEKELFDCSTHLSKIMSIVSQFEQLPEGDGVGWTPNYRAIYKFLGQILQLDRNEDVETLGPLESAIVLDLLYKLYEMVAKTDVHMQKKVMCWKYSLLDYRNEAGNPDVGKMRQAARNEFSEFIDEEMRTSVIGDLAEDSRGPAKKGRRRKPTSVKTEEVTSNQSAAAPSRNVERPFARQDASGHVIVDRHKPGRKKKEAAPEQPITSIVYVIPPKDSKIVNFETRKKAAPKERDDGKYQSLKESHDTIISDCIQKKHKVFYDIKTSKLDDFIQRDTAIGVPVKQKQGIETIGDVTKRTEQKMAVKRQFDELRTNNKDNENAPLKKPKLYAINPLCVPVKILNLELA